MGAANDLMGAFFKECPEAQAGKLSLQQINERLEQFQEKINNQSLPEFDGLSPVQMHNLLYSPLSSESLLQISPSAEPFVQNAPFFRLAEILLAEIVKPGGLKLTTRGNLPVRVCQLLFGQQLIHYKYIDEVTKIIEENVPYLTPLKEFVIGAGLAKKRNNTLSVTREGTRYMKQPALMRFNTMLLFFGRNYNWKNLGYPDFPEGWGQLGWAYALVLLHKYGNVAREVEFYSGRLMTAFEKNLSEEGAEWFHRVYGARFFESFANWFGLVTITREKGYSFFDRVFVKKSEVFQKVFYVHG